MRVAWTFLLLLASCDTSDGSPFRHGNTLYYDPVRERVVATSGQPFSQPDFVWEGDRWLASTDVAPDFVAPGVVFDERLGVPNLFGFSTGGRGLLRYVAGADGWDGGPAQGDAYSEDLNRSVFFDGQRGQVIVVARRVPNDPRTPVDYEEPLQVWGWRESRPAIIDR